VRKERPSNGAGDRRFEILCQPAAATKPCESTFDDPSAWQKSPVKNSEAIDLSL
jgi:hypothetical protein